jgi:hypothetical protein
MALLEKVKPGIGVFYSDATKDAEIQQMIDGAVAFFKGAGWEIDPSLPTPLAVEAVTLYCKMRQSTDPAQLTVHPVLVAYIVQGKTETPLPPENYEYFIVPKAGD